MTKEKDEFIKRIKEVDEMFKKAGVEPELVGFLRKIQSCEAFKGKEVEKEYSWKKE